MTAQSGARGKVLLGLGANCPGPWGTPAETLRRALGAMEKRGVRLLAVSDFYETAALGPAGQPAYVNAVALIDTSLSAPSLLRLLKQIEAKAGRRGGKPWGPRPLDLDVIDYKGLVHNSAKRATKPRPGARPLSLPHPGLTARAFVLKPLLDVAPSWRHPVSKESGAALWRGVSKRGQGRVLKRIS